MSTARSVARGGPDWKPPRGRHRLPFQVVAENQHRRLLAGVATALSIHGYAALTVQHVIEAAGVSRTTFYANFNDKRDAVLAAHADAFQRLLGVIVAACASEREWPLKMTAAIAATFALLADEPASARLLTLNSAAVDLTIARQVSDSNAHLAALLREGRRHAPNGPAPPDLTEEGLIGAVATILGARLMDGAGDPAVLETEVAQLLLAPYLGRAEAVRVASRPRPARAT